MASRVEEYLSKEITRELPVASERIKVLAIVGGPIKGGNVEWAASAACSMLESYGNVDTEVIHLADYNIEYCKGCEFCMRNCTKHHMQVGMDIRPAPIAGYNCTIKDDMPMLMDKLMEADGIILAAPVYISTIPANMKNFIDRCRTFIHDYRLWGKVAMPIDVAFFRNCGADVCGWVMTGALRAMGMVTTSCAELLSSGNGAGIPIKDTRYAVAKDPLGMASLASITGQFGRMLQVIKAGKTVLNADFYEPWKLPTYSISDGTEEMKQKQAAQAAAIAAAAAAKAAKEE